MWGLDARSEGGGFAMDPAAYNADLNHLPEPVRKDLLEGSALRALTLGDTAELSVMGTRFVRYSPFGQHMLVPKEEIAIGLQAQFAAGAGGFAAIRDGRIAGAIFGLVAPLWFSPSVTVAYELAWWVEKEHRAGPIGIRLLHEFERWGAERGAKFAALSDLVVEGEPPLQDLLARLGYRLTERAHLRSL